MSNLWVVAFETENGAERMLTALADWQKQKLIKIDDAATLVRRADGKVITKHADKLVGKGAKKGAIIGGIVGVVFLNPVAGAAAGSAIGGLVGRRKGKKQIQAGISPEFIKEVTASMQPGTSAIFGYTREGVAEKILPQLKKLNGRLIHSNLSAEQDAELREAFGEEKEAVGAARE